MAFFRKNKLDPVERLEGELRDKLVAREKLADRLTTAETALVDKREAAQRLAMAGAADQALDNAEAATRAAEDRATTLREALGQLDREITEAEQQLAQARVQRDRDLVADELETMASAIAAAAPDYNVAALKLIEAITKSSATMLEANQFAASLDAMRRDVGSASALISAELRATAVRTRSGQARITLREPPAPEPPPPPEIPRTMVYTLSRVRWEENGATRTAPAYAQIDLPSALLSAALRHNLADRLCKGEQSSGSNHFQTKYDELQSVSVGSG